MKKITNRELVELLQSKPLYYKLTAVKDLKEFESNSFLAHHNYTDIAFKYKCPHENDIQTFRTQLPEDHHMRMSRIIMQSEDQLPYMFDENSRQLDLTFHLQGVCQSCNKKIDFLLRVFSDNTWDLRKDGINIYIQKVGQYPSYEINLSNDLKKYLNSEDQENYKKALICLSNSYGIGAYSYLRRIIENEIKRIIKDISQLDFEGSFQIKEAFDKFEQDHQMSNLISIVNKHLPISMQELGDNPIKLLYEELSGGIHEFSDIECLEMSESIDVLLNYVVKKINEEKYQLGAVKDAMRKLRKNQS
ncbi:hypothetical protein [uncultured Draconibacterium sp.]|uniref:hypothetical protein n=1 Tax=uncultured Draconibacterium sp. TaxID=1573823 RepID=UPI0025E1F61D|nr:hypothetical protein [uncultured Draconibacterium sp.]